MVGRSHTGAINEDAEGSTVSERTVSELISWLKSEFRKAAFTRVEEELVSREERMKKEIEEKIEENRLLQEKLYMEVLEKLKIQKEFDDLKELASRLREERDGLLKTPEENVNDKKDNFEKFAVMNLDMETNAGKQKMSPNVSSRLKTEKTDCDAKVFSETNPSPSGSSSHRKRLVADNWRPLSEEIVEIIDSDDESTLHENTGGVAAKGQLDKSHLGKNVAEDEPTVQKRTLASSMDSNENCTIEKGKRVKIQEHGPFASPSQHRPPTALDLESLYYGKVDTSSKLSKLLSELGDDSSSSSGSDDELDLSLDYSNIFKINDFVSKNMD